MSPSQLAISLAMVYPEPDAGGRGQPLQIYKGLEGTERNAMQVRLSKARLVLRVAPGDLAPQVLVGSLALEPTYTEAREREQAAS